MDHVFLYTDGACSGNPGPGGYCAILRWGKIEKTVSDLEEKVPELKQYRGIGGTRKK